METVQSLWIGPELSPFEALCIRTFLAHGHAFDLYTYGDVANVPAGCTLRDGRSIVAEDRIFVHQQGPEKGSVAGFADVFRYDLLRARGGWWVDTDVVCLSSRLPDVAVALAAEDAERVNCAILRFPRGHPAIDYACARAAAAGPAMPWGEIGPDLITQIVPMFGLESALLPRESFYPIHYGEAFKLIDPAHRDYVVERTRGATFLHLWNEMFRRAGFDKRVRPPRGSYLYGLMAEHGMLRDFRWEYAAVSTGDRVRMQRVALDPAQPDGAAR